MHITVAICSWNRARLLRQALASLAEITPPPGVTWEIVAVNNNSTDETAQVLQEATEGLPLVPVFEPRSGLSYARNRAVATARGDYILWTDDDVVVDGRWLEEYVAAFRANPAAALFGGSTRVLLEDCDRPAWFQEVMPVVGQIFGAHNEDIEGPILLDGPRLPFGVNMAVRTDVQRAYLFDVGLGRKGAQLRSNEETQVIRAMLRDGHSGVWVPGARLQHVVAREGQTESYLCRWYEGYGQTLGGLEQEGHMTSKRAPLWAWRQALVDEVLYRVLRHAAAPTRWVEHLRLSRFARGYLRGRLQMKASWS